VVDQRWINTSTNTATDRFQYGYDQDDNVLYKNNLVNSSFSELYHANGSSNGYDNLNQLVAFARGTLNGSNDTISSPTQSESWSMDALGNFTSVSGTTETNNLQNEATGFGSATLTYDANGNLTTDQSGNTLVYDAWNRLVAYKNGSTTLETMAYDGLGREIITNSGTATDLYYSNQWQVLEERVGGAAKVHYVWSPVYVDALVLRDRDATGSGTLSERLWVQQDADWNVTALVNGSGSVVERYVYDPYGNMTVLTASWGSTSGSAYAWIYGHQGGRLDTTTGLYGFRHRTESPVLDRWAKVDPMGFGAGDSNLYRYVKNNPMSAVDPSGLGIRPPRLYPPGRIFPGTEDINDKPFPLDLSGPPTPLPRDPWEEIVDTPPIDDETARIWGRPSWMSPGVTDVRSLSNWWQNIWIQAQAAEKANGQWKWGLGIGWEMPISPAPGNPAHTPPKKHPPKPNKP